MEWKPIETAPKDTGRYRLGRWEEGDEWRTIIAPIYETKLKSSGFLGFSTDEVLVKTWEGERFTHWKHLPEPPK